MPKISVIICTYNPKRALLREVADALAPQLKANDAELILVDNNSAIPVEPDDLGAASKEVNILRETRQGLAFARVRGIEASRSELLVFVDDDNILAPNYIETCLKIAASDASLGVVAGRSTGAFAHQPNCAIKPHLERYAVRDLGDRTLCLTGEKWQLGEPYGAGVLIRKKIGIAFVDLIDRIGENFQLGRSGNSLASGEDTLFSRLAFKLGFRVAYDPKLHLTHVIADERLKLRYFLRLLEAQGSSHAILEAMCGRPRPLPRLPIPIVIVLRAYSRLRHQGACDAFTFIWWDIGELTTLWKIHQLGPHNLAQL